MFVRTVMEQHTIQQFEYKNIKHCVQNNQNMFKNDVCWKAKDVVFVQ